LRENGEGSAELWAASRHKALRAKNLVSTRFFTLSDHAARQSGPEEKYAEAFSPMGSAELWAVPRHKALRAKNLVSTIFFTLEVPRHKKFLSEYLFFGSRAKCLYEQKKKE
jgi:hypothetical protein